MNLYCTYFDHRYLDRGLAMLRSLRAVEPERRIAVLCLSKACEQALRGLDEPGVTLIPIADFERANPDLAALKKTRDARDYVLAFAACLVASQLRGAADGDIVTYLDADLFFYSTPEPIYRAMEDTSVGLIGHRHHWWTRRLEKYGRVNVGWVSFRADAAGRAASDWWRARCIEWCFADLEKDRFAEQKYLDSLSSRFPGVVEIAHPGANLGPWNVGRHSIAFEANRFVIDRRFPLIFFHFSQVRETRPDIYLCSNVSYLAPFTPTVRNHIYKPYLRELRRIREELGGLPEDDTPDLRGGLPLKRLRIIWLLRVAGWAMGHYVKDR